MAFSRVNQYFLYFLFKILTMKTNDTLYWHSIEMSFWRTLSIEDELFFYYSFFKLLLFLIKFVKLLLDFLLEMMSKYVKKFLRTKYTHNLIESLGGCWLLYKHRATFLLSIKTWGILLNDFMHLYFLFFISFLGQLLLFFFSLYSFLVFLLLSQYLPIKKTISLLELKP